MVEENSGENELENLKILVKRDDCTKCKMCVKVCPFELFYFKDDNLQISSQFEESCIECGHCVSICPVNIISLKKHSAEEIKLIPKKEDITTYDALLNLARVRRSIRHFKAAPVPREILEKILELARYTATGHNEENIHYTVVQDPETLKNFSEEITSNVANFVNKYEDPEGQESLKKVLPTDVWKKAEKSVISFKRKLDTIKRGKEPWRWNAQIIVIHSPKNAATSIENCSLAAGNIMLAAESLGLATCSLGYATSFTNQFRTVAKIIKLPRNHVVAYVLSIGYSKMKYKRIPAREPVKVKWL